MFVQKDCCSQLQHAALKRKIAMKSSRRDHDALCGSLWLVADHVVARDAGWRHVMKRIATSMIGGVISSAILNLLIYPVIYVIWRRRELSQF